jgi:hypothetical protein
MRFLAVGLTAMMVMGLTSCSVLNQVTDKLGGLGGKSATSALKGLKKPEIKVKHVKLTQSPTNRDLAGHLCQKRMPGFLCSLMGLRAPQASRMAFVFELQLEVKNNNAVPIPAVEVLTAFTAYPDEGYKSNLGAVCVSLCPKGEVCGSSRQGKCKASSSDIRSLADFGQRAVGFLLAVATGDASFSDLKVKTVAPGATLPITVTYRLGVKPALDLIERASKKAVAALKSRKMPQFRIPYAVEGTLFFEVKNFGRIAASYGPVKNVWVLK